MSTLQTPRQRLQRPSYGNMSTSAEKQQLALSTSSAINRKASLQALSGGPMDLRTPSANGNMDVFDVGDMVNVPGEMYGTVKFVGTVKGKSGQFVGVELAREFAGKGKNDGDVEGISYFRTSIPGSGIFLPVHRAEKRFSPTFSSASPISPTTPSHSIAHAHRNKTSDKFTPPTPGIPLKFSQSVGPGARPSSPQFKPKRPSLPRPESPLRRQAPPLAPTPARGVLGGGRTGLSATTPSKNNLRASTNTRVPTQSSRPYSRSGSRLSGIDGSFNDDISVAGSNGIPSFPQPARSGSRLGSAGGQDAEIQRLRRELAERDKRLEEQAVNFAEMENSVKELSAMLPNDLGSGDGEEHTIAQLRQLLREKNEKIGLLTTEFDAHRADFRSTLDSLEMASTETERVYEEQKHDLLHQINELQEIGSSREDFEGVAQQLKQLEELVAELEEGLEESRRGEAEARGEVEFLRGEVERGRSELKREREKAAANLNGGKGGESSKDVEARDDEIRGLKAIIHSLSSNPTAAMDAQSYAALADEVKKLQEALSGNQRDKEELEKQLEQLRRDSAVTNGHKSSHNRTESQRTTLAIDEHAPPGRHRADTIRAPFAEHARRGIINDLPPGGKGTTSTTTTPAAGVYCEMCESSDHDTLDCRQLQTSDTTASEVGAANQSLLHADVQPKYSPGKENEQQGHDDKPREIGGGGRGGGVDQWCALCEKDGHLAFDCPDEQY